MLQEEFLGCIAILLDGGSYDEGGLQVNVSVCVPKGDLWHCPDDLF